MVLRSLGVLLILLWPLSAMAEKRIALIVGNDAYAEVTPLQKAVADARAMAQAMAANGYETILATDVDRRAFNLAISELTGQLEAGDTAFIFYAGHGVQIEGENYLLPTDIAAPAGADDDFVTSESIALSRLLDRVRRTGARTTLAILDACRDNPFQESTGRSIGGTRGLARIAAPEGTFVMFSAGAGQQALDRLNETDEAENSVFTRLLLPKLSVPDLELRSLISDLRIEVRDLARTENHAQFPAYYDELLGEFYFSTAAADDVAGRDTPEIRDEPVSSEMRKDFELAQQIGTASAFQAFISRYAGREDFTLALAKQMLAEIEDASAIPEQSSPADEAPQAPVQDARAIILNTQRELNRLGCNAGGADGIVGARTRAAFARFIADTGAGLQPSSLGTDTALAALRSAQAPACKARVIAAPATTERSVAATPTYSMTGTWAWVAKCPLFITVTGKVTFRSNGGGSYSGAIVDSNGQQAVATTQLSGRTLQSRVVGVLTSQESGQLSSSGNSYTVTNSLGCQITGNRM